jgi:hypothetical protein
MDVFDGMRLVSDISYRSSINVSYISRWAMNASKTAGPIDRRVSAGAGANELVAGSGGYGLKKNGGPQGAFIYSGMVLMVR